MAAADNATLQAINQLAQNIQPSNNIFLEFMLSPFFIMFLIYVLIFTPFGVIGIFSLYGRIKNWSRTRSGWMKMRKKLSNLHWIYFWIRPTGRKANIKTEEGIEIELPLELQEGMLGLEKEIADVHFASEKKQKKGKEQRVLDVHVEKPPTKEEMAYAQDILRRMVK